MKRLFLVAFLLVFTFTLFCSSVYASKEAEAIYGTPEIDAEIDPIWEDVPAIQLDNTVWADSHEAIANALTGKYRLMWDENYLYVLAEVYDSVINKNAEHAETDPHLIDSVEFFIDEDNAKRSSYGTSEAQYRVDFENVKSVGPNGEPDIDNFITATKMTDFGYIAEVAVPFKTPKSEGMEIGFEGQINDDQGAGTRQAVVAWNQVNGDAWKDPSEFGTVRLAAASAASSTETEPIESRNNTTIYIIAGAAVVLIILIVALVARKSKKD